MTKSDPKFRNFGELCNQNGFAATFSVSFFLKPGGMHNHPTAEQITKCFTLKSPSVSPG